MQRGKPNRSQEQESDPADAIRTDRDPMPTDEAEEEKGIGLLKRLFPEKSPAELESMSRQIADSQETEEMLKTPPNELPYEPQLEISGKEWGKLCHAARNPQLRSEEANIYMWSRLYRLHHWICVNTGGELCLKPFVGIVNEKPSLMLFTSEEAAADFIATNRLAGSQRGSFPGRLHPAGNPCPYSGLRKHGHRVGLLQHGAGRIVWRPDQHALRRLRVAS